MGMEFLFIWGSAFLCAFWGQGPV